MKVRDVVAEDNKKFFAYLMLTCKNVSLYPEGHSISINAIRHFHETLEDHIRKYGNPRIEIEKDRVVCQGVEVFKGTLEEGTLPFTLFRDGIRWLEFADGIDLEETRKVLSLIHKYSVLTKEPEGDIVTAFWESHFSHILYKVDDFSGEEPEEFDMLSESDATYDATSEKAVESAAPEEAADDAVGSDDTIHPADFVLTPQENIELQEMISGEENSSATEHLNMLLDMLLQFQEEDDFNVIMGVLAEEFEGSYNRHDFEAALIILDGVRKILDSGRIKSARTRSLIESFYQDIASDAKCLNPLENIWSRLNLTQIETLKNIFQHLHPKSVATLVRFLLLGQSSHLEKIVDQIVFSLASEDISCMDSLVNRADERIAEKIVPVISRIEGETAFKYLMKLARHSSATIRQMSLKAIGQFRGNHIKTIFEFIDDPDPAVRQFVLMHMGQSKNEAAEDILMEYLLDHEFSSAQNDHLVECFRTLGKCGSSKSVPFLRQALLHRKWLAGFKKSAYREGAILALAALKIPEARQVIVSASRSLHPGLRMIARRALKEFFQTNNGGR
jgi:hypothetical protein